MNIKYRLAVLRNALDYLNGFDKLSCPSLKCEDCPICVICCKVYNTKRNVMNDIKRYERLMGSGDG